MTQTIDAAAFQQMVIHAAAAISAQKQHINDLNVFPVPDGDTGTNMSLTNSAAAAADVLHDHGVTIEALADGIGHQAGGQVNAAAGVVGNDHSDVLGGKLNGSSALSESAARSRSKSACRGLGAASGKDRDSQNSSASQC